MPTVIHVKAFKLYFYSNERLRCHVHVRHKSGIEASVWLDDLSIKKTSGDSRIDKACIDLAKKYKGQIVIAWNEHFGVRDEEE